MDGTAKMKLIWAQRSFLSVCERIIAFAVFIGGIYLIRTGQSISGAAVSIGAFAALLAVFTIDRTIRGEKVSTGKVRSCCAASQRR